MVRRVTQGGRRTVLVALLLPACTADIEQPGTTSAGRTITTCRETQLAWGTGPSEAGLLPAATESLARGPQAVAVAPDGTTLVLDALNRRVLAIGATGEVRVAVTGVAREAEALAVGPDGALAVYTPLTATVAIFEPSGAPAGTVALDRALRHVTGVSLGASRQVHLRTAYQETLTAGSPTAPVALPTLLAGKREGAFVLADGRGVVTRAHASGTELVVLANPAGRRASERAVHALPGTAQAAQLIGLADDVACVRTERVAQTAERVSVSRDVACLNVSTGRVVLDQPLAPPGIYLPPHELALGGTPPRLAALEPAPDHLVVRSCEVSR